MTSYAVTPGSRSTTRSGVATMVTLTVLLQCTRERSIGVDNLRTAGACRCPHCRAAFAAYRARRRDNGLDSPRGPRAVPDTDGHVSRNWWRNQVWTPACATAE